MRHLRGGIVKGARAAPKPRGEDLSALRFRLCLSGFFEPSTILCVRYRTSRPPQLIPDENANTRLC